MRHFFLFLLAGTILLPALTSHVAQAQESPRELFERARMLDERNQNLSEAIALYSRAAEASTDQRRLAAEARLRVGLLYERLGQTRQAQRIFAEVVRDYADQVDVAEQARARMVVAAPVSSEEADGLVVKRVWAEAVDLLGQVSPDGRYISYTDWSTGDLAVHSIETGETSILTDKGGWSDSYEYAEVSTWAPDGEHLVFSWYTDPFYELRIIGRHGGAPRVLYSNPEIGYLWPAQWSPDGKRILAVLAPRDGSNKIALISVEDGTAQILKTMPWSWPHTLRFSPDGRFIAYDFNPDEDNDQHDLFVIAADGSSERRVVAHDADERLLDWTPDGKHLLFTSDRRGTIDLWRIPVDGDERQGEDVLIRQDVGDIRPMGFTSSGTFHYGLSISMRDVYMAHLHPSGTDMSEPVKITRRFEGKNVLVDFSGDGKYVAYLSRRGSAGGDVLVIRDLETNQERELRLSPLLTLRKNNQLLRLSPKGRYALVAGIGKNTRKEGFYRVDTNTGTVELLARDDPAGGMIRARPGFPMASWAADGKAIYFIRKAASSQRIVRLDLATGVERELYRVDLETEEDLLYNPIPSPDGQYLTFSAVDQVPMRYGSLLVMPAEGGEAREILRLPEAWMSPLAWTPESTHVVYVRDDPSSYDDDHMHTLWRLAIDGGAPQQMEGPEDAVGVPCLHPDGTHIAFIKGEDRQEVWSMERFLPGTEGTR